MLLHNVIIFIFVGKVYHIAETGAMSEAVRPLRPDGSPDTDIMSRLAVRHDDSLENVANRLTLWDRQVSSVSVLTCSMV